MLYRLYRSRALIDSLYELYRHHRLYRRYGLYVHSIDKPYRVYRLYRLYFSKEVLDSMDFMGSYRSVVLIDSMYGLCILYRLDGPYTL